MVRKKWTILIYFFGEVKDESKIDLTKMAKVGSNQDINIVGEFEWEENFGNRRFYIKENEDYFFRYWRMLAQVRKVEVIPIAFTNFLNGLSTNIQQNIIW